MIHTRKNIMIEFLKSLIEHISQFFIGLIYHLDIASGVGVTILLNKVDPPTDWVDFWLKIMGGCLTAAIISAAKYLFPNGMKRIIAVFKITTWNAQMKLDAFTTKIKTKRKKNGRKIRSNSKPHNNLH